MSKIIVTQPFNAPEVPAEIIATSIQRIADSMEALKNTRLHQRALVALIQADTGLAKRDIVTVLESLAELSRTWLKPAPSRNAALAGAIRKPARA